jgi:hypothetical protein
MHKIAVVATLVLATGAVGSTHTGASSTPAASCLPSWRLVKTPRVGIGEFTAAAATSPKDAWVVGDSFGGCASAVVDLDMSSEPRRIRIAEHAQCVPVTIAERHTSRPGGAEILMLSKRVCF